MARGLCALLASATLFCSPALGAGSSGSARFDPATVRVVGRVQQHPDALEYSWPGIYFEGRFQGEAIGLKFSDDSSHFNIEIDGLHHQVLSRPGDRTVWVQGLSPGTHLIRVQRRNESHHPSGRFRGFELRPGERLLPAPAARQRQMVFFGDSLTLGYGNTSGRRDCGDAELSASTDSAQSFASLTARHLEADLELNAYSGLGLVRNYGDALPGTDYRTYAHRTLTQDPQSVWVKPAHWNPGIVVLTLGGPDFAGLDASERWTAQTLPPVFKQAYLDFLKRLRGQYGSEALFVLGIPEDGSQRLAAVVQELIAEQRQAGLARIDAFRIDMNSLEALGCHWHASVRDHQAIARQLLAVIERWSIPGWVKTGQ